MKRFNSIKKNEEFRYIYKNGKSYANKNLVMYVIRTDNNKNRIGISVNWFFEYLKNQNDDCFYEFKKTGEIYEYDGPDLKTVHFIYNKHYIDVLRRRK